jgi:YHS domain-containing protein
MEHRDLLGTGAFTNGTPIGASVAAAKRPVRAIMRQIGKKSLTIAAFLTAMAWAGITFAAGIVTTIVTDPLTGVAIDGYDPVTYFTESEPQLGKPDYEYYWGGVPWYFVNAANRDVFIRTPEIYAPQHGGHCEMSLARGYLSDGKPRIYVVAGRKLYFFYSAANRDAFMLARPAATRDAAANWPKFTGELSTR